MQCGHTEYITRPQEANAAISSRTDTPRGRHTQPRGRAPKDTSCVTPLTNSWMHRAEGWPQGPGGGGSVCIKAGGPAEQAMLLRPRDHRGAPGNQTSLGARRPEMRTLLGWATDVSAQRPQKPGTWGTFKPDSMASGSQVAALHSRARRGAPTSFHRCSGMALMSTGWRSITFRKRASGTAMAQITWIHLRQEAGVRTQEEPRPWALGSPHSPCGADRTLRGILGQRLLLVPPAFPRGPRPHTQEGPLPPTSGRSSSAGLLPGGCRDSTPVGTRRPQGEGRRGPPLCPGAHSPASST